MSRFLRLALLFAFSGSIHPADASTYRVSVVPSDAPELMAPQSRTTPLSVGQIETMTRRAVDLVGGMATYVDAKDTLVVLKVNISILEPSGSGVVTDTRVVRAVALLVHEVAPEARILIAEGAGGWISPAMRDCTQVEMRGGGVEDGFRVAGHRQTAAELRKMGIDIECFDLNFDRAYELHPEGGGLAHDEYSIAAAIIDADTWINIPVAKTHGAKITCCLKNHFGILPGRLYGWGKNSGTAHHGPMPHSPRVLDEAWVDLYEISRVDLNVVDMIYGSQAGAFEDAGGKRSNTILAGANPIATDLVVARLMGYNPDDFEFAPLAARQGLGPSSIDAVTVVGVDSLGPLVDRWKKAGVAYGGRGEWAEHADYGMGPREWTLLGPLPREHTFSDEEITALQPVPGEGDWSPVTWFGHDRIDLDKQFDDPINCAVYAYTQFTMATSDSVRFWLGSDEGLSLWIDGKLIYEHTGRRRHSLGMVKLPGYVEAGKHHLLIRADQRRGAYDFSFNIAEPIDDILYHGNRYPGVRYHVGDTGQEPIVQVAADDVGDDYGAGQRDYAASTIDLGDPLQRSRTAPDTILIDGVQAESQQLLALLLELAGVDPIDTSLLEGLGRSPFGIGYGGRGRESWHPSYNPDFSRLLSWLGLDYTVFYGLGQRETMKMIHGLLADGFIPVTTTMERSRRRRGYRGGQSRWTAIDGFRRQGGHVELHQAAANRWVQVTGDWDGFVPGGNRENCPVFVARASREPLSAAALIDTMASIALELGRSGQIVEDSDSGQRFYPRGLAAWDAWVIDWERRPLTIEWALKDHPLDQLEGMRRRVLEPLVHQRQSAARSLAGAASATTGERRDALQAASDGYRAVAEHLDELSDYLPREDRVEDLSKKDHARLARLQKARPLLRQARTAEREALTALLGLVGGPPLAKIQEDPLRRRAQGVRLFTWHAITDDNVHDLIYTEQQLEVRLVAGGDANQMSYEIHEAMPREPGWQIVIEAGDAATGSYTVHEAPSHDNGWRIVVRADDERTWRDNAPELVVWAVPDE
ncbi:MAG: DUF362 domain-containing protein [Gemmatimonadetes bacterium]|nr:DUF362 domain-containing protein [Gemmatimonadota bacterium]MBT7862318.1 DUF362 domain-containing protein [Gemmatimonadota bacterium]